MTSFGTTLLIAAVCFLWQVPATVQAVMALPQPSGPPSALVLDVIDGDTADVRLDGRTERIRMIGIDTPETVKPSEPVECFGPETSSQGHALLDGKMIRLERDPSQNTRDQYGRLLVYSWLPDGHLFNLEIVTQGYAIEYTYKSAYKYQALFRQAEREAATARRALRTAATCNGNVGQLAAQAQPAAPAQQGDRRCFPETGQCLSGRFRAYWEQNGGLPVFGFPITAAANEVNRDTGQPYLTQWLERNRFELHPENRAPYDVLLGRLGDDRLRQLGRNWQAEPRESGPKSGCRWFAQTGHNVCDQAPGIGFKTYWETHGLEFDGRRGTSEVESLALFGLALTEPRMETNASGDNVLTQWFERARFEFHPNKPDQFKVLLGLLGNEVRTGGSTPAPQPQPQPPAPPPPPPPAPAPPAPPSPPPPSFNGCQEDPNPMSAPEFPVRIMDIDKERETVVLRNISQTAVNLDGWHVCSINGDQDHQGIGGPLAPGETRTFPHTNPGPIWNNTERDDGALYDAQGRLIDYYYDDGR